MHRRRWVARHGILDTPKYVGTPRNAWQAFLKEGRAQHTMKELGRQWSTMSEEQRAAYQPAAGEHPAPDVVAAPRFSPPWPACGDQDYPIKAASLALVSERVDDFCHAWRDRIGPVVAQGTEPICGPGNTCEELYGRGKCRDTMPANEKQGLDNLYLRFGRWSSIFKLVPGTFNTPWSKQLSLLYVGPPVDAVAGSVDSADAVSAIMLCKRQKQQMFYAEECTRMAPGDVISFQPSVENIMDRVEFARLILEHAAWGVYMVNYTQIGLATFRIVDFEPMAQKEMDLAIARKEAREASKLEKMTRLP